MLRRIEQLLYQICLGKHLLGDRFSMISQHAPMPVVPGSASDVVGELAERKKRSRPFDSAEPIYLKVIGHKQDVAWEEKREADLQKSFIFMKWISVLQCWRETWKVRQELDECETVQASCELVGFSLLFGESSCNISETCKQYDLHFGRGSQAWLSVSLH